MLLWLAVIWPLLLAIPALHTRLPSPQYLAIIPAVVLVLLPGNYSLPLPWLLFGSGLAMGNNTRWMLAMLILLWILAIFILQSGKNQRPDNRPDNYTNTFYLLAISGSLGAALVSDLAGFFSCTSLMGYSFYGVLIQNADRAQQRAARHYLIVLILADLLLFEALLLAASASERLHYLSVSHAMMVSDTAGLYFWMVCIGFALKAGVWPAHLWLSALYRNTTSAAALLLFGVPVSIAMLGLLRWLPFSVQQPVYAGMLVQIIGLMAILYATAKIVFNYHSAFFAARLSTLLSGVFITALGTGIQYSDIWQQYAFLSYPFITISAILMAGVVIKTQTAQASRRPTPPLVPQRIKALMIKTEQQLTELHKTGYDKLFTLRSRWRKIGQHISKSWQRFAKSPQHDIYLSGWHARITFFVVLGVVLVWLAG